MVVVTLQFQREDLSVEDQKKGRAAKSAPYIYLFHFSILGCLVKYLRNPGGGLLYIFWVRGLAIGKGIDFHDFGIRNGINFHNFRNWCRVGYAFS